MITDVSTGVKARALAPCLTPHDTTLRLGSQNDGDLNVDLPIAQLAQLVHFSNTPVFGAGERSAGEAQQGQTRAGTDLLWCLEMPNM